MNRQTIGARCEIGQRRANVKWVALMALLFLGACASEPVPAPAPRIAAVEQAAAASEALPYFVGVDGLSLYPEPKAANAKSTLALHEKVTRSRVERGWASVTVETSGEQGWVDNAALIWRLPTPAAAEPLPASAGANKPLPSTEASLPEAPESAAPPTPLPPAAGSGRAPSVLDAY
jgi:hypothetical protein